MGSSANANAASPIDALIRRRLLIVSGKGGVGRTTMAAMLGLAAARRGRRVLVGTTGHDDRLAWMLGLERLEDAPRRAATNLDVQRLVPLTCVREYGTLALKSQRLATAVFENRVVAKLLGAVPGLDDFAVLGKVWHDATRGQRYDLVIFDGPASGHLRYVLGVPRAILRSVQPGPLTREAEAMQATLDDAAQAAAVLIALPEPWPLTEMSELGQALHDEVGLAVGAVLVNGVLDATLPELEPPALEHDEEGVVAPVFAEIRRQARLAHRQRDSIEAWRASVRASARALPPTLGVAWQWGGLDSLPALYALLDAVDDHGVAS